MFYQEKQEAKSVRTSAEARVNTISVKKKVERRASCNHISRRVITPSLVKVNRETRPDHCREGKI